MDKGVKIALIIGGIILLIIILYFVFKQSETTDKTNISNNTSNVTTQPQGNPNAQIYASGLDLLSQVIELFGQNSGKGNETPNPDQLPTDLSGGASGRMAQNRIYIDTSK